MRTSIWAAVVAVAVAGSAVLYGVSGASADDADTPPSTVEDYSYPGAAQIAAQYPGLQLLKGDGNILFKGYCTDTTGMLVVESDITPSIDDKFCFQVLSSVSGYLTLTVPTTYFVDGDGTHKIEATVSTDDGRTLQTNVGLTGFTPVGEGTGEDNIGSLVELRVGWDPGLPQP